MLLIKELNLKYWITPLYIKMLHELPCRCIGLKYRNIPCLFEFIFSDKG